MKQRIPTLNDFINESRLNESKKKETPRYVVEYIDDKGHERTHVIYSTEGEKEVEKRFKQTYPKAKKIIRIFGPTNESLNEEFKKNYNMKQRIPTLNDFINESNIYEARIPHLEYQGYFDKGKLKVNYTGNKQLDNATFNEVIDKISSSGPDMKPLEIVTVGYNTSTGGWFVYPGRLDSKEYTWTDDTGETHTEFLSSVKTVKIDEFISKMVNTKTWQLFY